MEQRPIAYQVYSARDEAQQDLAAVLRQLADMGYDGVEFAGFYGHSAAEVRAMLDQNGLKAISSHVPFDQIRRDPFGVIAYHQAIGAPYIAVPYLGEDDRPGSAGFARSIRDIRRFGALCREAGIQLLYHNHDFEFTAVSGEYGLDFLYETIEPELLQTELDMCWVKYAGVDPAQYVRKYAGRCPVVHLKDYVGRKGDKSPYALIGDEKSEQAADTTAFEFRPVGHGCQNVPEIVEASIESGAQWFVVEQDLSVGRPPLEAARMSIETLKKIGLK
jgi:sugar phosphate isomerase/epimerase